MPRDSLIVAGVAAILVLATAGAVATGLGTAGAQSTAQPADRTVSVAATGNADASPDRAVVRVAATAEGNSSAEVRDALAADAEALRTALDELGVDYETIEYRIHSVDEHDRRPPREGGDASAADYRGVHAYQVTLDDTNRTGAVIDAAADAGAEVSDVELTLSEEKRTELRKQAIRNAMNDARSQADTIAEAGSLEVTNVATVDASQSRYRPVRYEAAAAGDGAAAETVVSEGEVSVTYRVQVTYNATTA
ncbi:MAG: SIMPL domain-containing protein [Haloarculaceae archaeon]